MATVSGHLKAAPDEVFAILADGWYYPDWVVGTSHMRAVDPGWPAVGTRLHHASGIWPLAIRDQTLVEVSEPGVRLVLLAQGRPFGHARVDITLMADPTGTTLTMVEAPVAGPGKWLHNPVGDLLLKVRNIESLKRLTSLVERRASTT